MSITGSKVYLGDGVYAAFIHDGGPLRDDTMLKLWTSDGVSERNIIFLEPGVYDNLVAFVAVFKQATTEQSSELRPGI